MVPTVRPGDVLLVRWRPGRHRPPPGAVVILALPDRPMSVKRVRRIDGDRLWVEGDNAAASTDSRELGWLPTASVLGRVWCRLWPRPGRVAPDPFSNPSGRLDAEK